MIIAYGEANKAKWALDAQGDFRTLVITDNDKKKEELKFKLDEYSIYLFCKDGKPYEIGNRMLYNFYSFTPDNLKKDWHVLNKMLL